MAQNSLPPPPKFKGKAGAVMPTTVEEGLQLIRWFVSLWTKAENSTTDQQVRAFTPGQGLSTTEAVAEALALAKRPQASNWGAGPWQTDVSALRALVARAEAANAETRELATLAFIQATKPSIPLSAQPTPAFKYGIVVEGTHNERISTGTGTITGQVLTGALPSFSASWIGFQIAVNGALFNISGFTDASNITLDGTLPTGAVGWQFIKFPTNFLPAMSAFLETDRKVIYRAGDSFGTADLNGPTVTWVSGPKFSPYWAGIQFTIGGVNYSVAFSTQTTLTLTTDSGIVASALDWATVNSSWFYETGTEQTTVADLLARLSLFDITDDAYQIDVYDYKHQIVLNGSSLLWDWRGNDASKYIVPSADGTAPRGGLWQFCDGTASVNVFDIIAGVPQLTPVNAPDLRSDCFPRGGTFTGVVDAAVAPTFSSSLTFSGTPATLTGSVAAPVFTGTPGTPTGTISTPTFTGTPGTPTGTVSAPVFSGAAGTPTGTVGTPTFTGAALATHNHDSPVGVISTTVGFITADFGTSIGTHTRNLDFTIGSSGGAAATQRVSSTSGGTPSGTVSAPALTMNTFTPSGTNSTPTFSGASFTPVGTISTPTFTGASFTPAGTNSAPALTMNSYTPAGTIGGTATIGSGGRPKSLALLYYLRR